MRGRSLSQLTTQIASMPRGLYQHKPRWFPEVHVQRSYRFPRSCSSCRDCRPRARIQGCEGEACANSNIRTNAPSLLLPQSVWKKVGGEAYYREHTVPYSGKLSREKTFANFAVLRQNAQVSPRKSYVFRYTEYLSCKFVAHAVATFEPTLNIQGQEFALYIYAKTIGCFNHWVVTLVAGDSGYEKYILVLVNCISNLSPNRTLQLTTLRTSVSESLQLHFKNMMLL